MTQVSGGCACGAKRFRVILPAEPHAYLCHCRMCQLASGNVSLAMVGVREADVQWEGEQPDWFRSSPIATRPFCRHCGTSLGFRYDQASAEGGPTEKMDLTVASFDDPSIFTPQSHFGAESMHRAWIDTSGLPETRSDDYAPLQKRWEGAK